MRTQNKLFRTSKGSPAQRKGTAVKLPVSYPLTADDAAARANQRYEQQDRERAQAITAQRQGRYHMYLDYIGRQAGDSCMTQRPDIKAFNQFQKPTALPPAGGYRTRYARRALGQTVRITRAEAREIIRAVWPEAHLVECRIDLNNLEGVIYLPTFARIQVLHDGDCWLQGYAADLSDIQPYFAMLAPYIAVEA